MLRWLVAATILVLGSQAGNTQLGTLPFSGAQSQLPYNIVTDFGAACNGDMQQVTATLTIGAGSNSLTSSTSLWVPGDQGKPIWVTGIGTAGATLQGTITYVSATNVTIGTNAITALSGSSQTVTWGTNDAAAFTGPSGFRATAVANQGNKQVVLTFPSGANCQFAGSAGDGIYTFAGVNNLIVSGYGASLTNMSQTQPMLFGGKGQYQDNLHSARTETVASGASCVTLKTQPQTNISNISSSGGTIRYTVASTAGYADGDTVYVRNVTGTTGLTNVATGLRWTRLIDGTTLDAFQSPGFAGTYTSGGTVGGDLTFLFVVGQPVVMTGYMLQNYWDIKTGYGFPSNQHWFEFLTVASVNSATQEVCFTTPLVNSYKSTWPQFNTGWAFEIDPGGPATLYALKSEWETTQEYRGFTLNPGTAQVIANGRSIKYKDMIITGAACAAPSQNVTHSYENVDMTSCNIEIDKLIGTLNVTGGTTRFWKFQSSSTNTMNATDHTVVVSMNGTPKVFNGDNVTFQCSGCSGSAGGFQPGAYAYGRSDETICLNCSITRGIQQGGLAQAVDNSGHTLCSMASGIITCPNDINTQINESVIRVVVPGSNNFFSGLLSSSSHFSVVDVTQDLTNIYIQTNLAGGFPSPASGGGVRNIVTHPAPKLTMTGSTGTGVAAQTIDPDNVANCPAQRPIYSCHIATYTGGASGTTAADTFPMWGILESLQMANVTPYGGAGSLSGNLSRFANWNVLTTGGSLVSFGTAPNGEAAINIKLPASCAVIADCTRELTPSGATNTQVGDALSAPPSGAWFGGFSNSGPNFSANTPSDSPQFSIRMLTDQGVVYP